MTENKFDASGIREANPDPLDSEKSLGKPFGTVVVILIVLMVAVYMMTIKKPATSQEPVNTSPSYQMERSPSKPAEAPLQQQAVPEPTQSNPTSTPSQDDPWNKFRK